MSPRVFPAELTDAGVTERGGTCLLEGDRRGEAKEVFLEGEAPELGLKEWQHSAQPAGGARVGSLGAGARATVLS